MKTPINIITLPMPCAKKYLTLDSVSCIDFLEAISGINLRRLSSIAIQAINQLGADRTIITDTIK